MSLETIAQRLLPNPIHQRLLASDIAKRIARGSAWSILGAATSRLLVLAGMILLARILGQAQFGEFGMVQSTMGIAGMMAGFGLGSTVTRFVAQHSKTNPIRAGRIIALVTNFSWSLIVVVGVIVTLGSGYMARDMLNAAHLQTALVLGILLMTAMTIRGLQSGILAGLERFDINAKLAVLEGLISLVGVVSLASVFGVEGGLLGLTLGLLVTWLVGRRALRRTLIDHKINVTQQGCWREKGILTSYTIPNFLANSLISPVLWYCMTVIAKRPGGYDDLALYNAAYQWHGPMMLIPLTLNAVSIPVLVQQWESGCLQKFRKIYLWNTGFLLAISALPVLIVTLLSPWIMSLYGAGFKNGSLILILLALAAPINALARMGTTALFGMHRAWSVFWLNVIWCAAMLTVATMLIPRMGASGMAIAFFSAYCVLMLLTIALVLWHLRQSNERMLSSVGKTA